MDSLKQLLNLQQMNAKQEVCVVFDFWGSLEFIVIQFASKKGNDYIFILPYNSSILIIPIEQMDLPYPSQKDAQLAAHLSPFARKRSLILKDSLKNIPQLPPIPPKLKRQVQYLIQLDYDYELKDLISRQVINLNCQIGRQGSEQTLVHLCCRVNAVKCLRYLIRDYYQFFPEEYQSWINAGNNERLTGAMLCALTGSNSCLKELLEAGGIDIHLIDGNKISAYQMALNSKNEKAVKMLMEYQNGSRRTKTVNSKYLQQAVDLCPNKVSICQTVYKCLLDCFTCQLFLQNKNVKNMRKKGPSLLGSGIECLFKQQLEIGYPQHQIAGDEVQWKLMSQYQERREGEVLYDTFSPFDMEDISHPISNFLIVFQSLSQNPWQVRKIIQPDKSKSGYFAVTLYPKSSCRCISVDSNLPFIANTSQPLFIADKKEGWPMLIQKAMAKHYGSYYKLNAISTVELMQTLTGWPVLKREITSCKQAVQLIQKMNSLGYMYVLQGKPNSLLYSSKHPNSCFTVLNFYSKGDKRMVLINCPFVDPAWVEKQRHQILALKILRGHYNCRGQMTIWVEEQRLKDYFSSILVTPIRSGYQRHTVIATASQKIYFRLQIEKMAEEPIVLYLLECDSGKLIKTSEVEGWYADTDKVKLLNADMFSQEMLSFDGEVGQYFFQATVPKGRYQIVGWACTEIKIDPLQESLGGLQWVSCLRQHLQKNWAYGDEYKMQRTDQYTLIVAQTQEKCTISGVQSLEVIEGVRRDKKSVDLIQDGHFRYCVLKGLTENIVFQSAH